MVQYYGAVACLHTLEQEMVVSLVPEHSDLMLVLLTLGEHTVKPHAVVAVAVEEQSQKVVSGRRGWVRMGIRSIEAATSFEEGPVVVP